MYSVSDEEFIEFFSKTRNAERNRQTFCRFSPFHANELLHRIDEQRMHVDSFPHLL